MKKEEIEFYRNNIFTALRRAKRPLGLDGICRVLFYGAVNDKNRALVRPRTACTSGRRCSRVRRG